MKKKEFPELLVRSVAKVIPRELAEKKLASGEKLRVYWGIDPTGGKIHLGHSVPMRKLQAFADAGHHVIFLIGSFTAMVGDPTGRDAMRQPLSKEQVQKNFETYQEQAGKILDFSKIELRYNHEWLEKMTFADIMKLSSHFTVQQMMQRDMFKERMKWKVVCAHCKELSDSPIQFQSVEDMEDADINMSDIRCSHCSKMTTVTKETIIPPPNPISPNEFLYPLMQGYDSVVLDVDFEIGGNDQLFNMLCGRKLQKVYNKREKCVLTTSLIEGTDGRKMSKTYENCIYLDDEPRDMYGKIMSMKDELILIYMECCTDIPMEEIASAKKEMKAGANPRDFKMRLGREIVSLYHSAEEAKQAEEAFVRQFQKKELPQDIREVRMKREQWKVVELLYEISTQNPELSLPESKGEIRRLITQNGIRVDGEIVADRDATVEIGATPILIQVGKRRLVRVLG